MSPFLIQKLLKYAYAAPKSVSEEVLKTSVVAGLIPSPTSLPQQELCYS